MENLAAIQRAHSVGSRPLNRFQIQLPTGEWTWTLDAFGRRPRPADQLSVREDYLWSLPYGVAQPPYRYLLNAAEADPQMGRESST